MTLPHIDMLVNYAGLVTLFAFALYGLRVLVSSYRLADLSGSITDLERQILQERIKHLRDRKNAEIKETELSWRGFRKFQVVRKVPEVGGIVSLYLEPHDGKPLPPFRPGQYLTFQMTIPGQQRPVIRCYSLSDSPYNSQYYRVSIKRVLPPKDRPGAPGGLVSNYFHNSVKEGDILDCKAPAGHFYLDMTKNRPVVLIGGGVGITPVLSMLNAVVESGSRREVWFFLGVRNSSEHCFREHLNRIALEHPNVKLQVCYSSPLASDRRGKDFLHAGRVSVNLIKKLLPSPNYDFYICGPGPMMDQVKADCLAWGVPPENFHMEAFGAATVKKVAAAAPGVASIEKAYEIFFKKSNKKVLWNQGSTLLECAEEAGIAMEAGCRAGNCGTCAVAITAGEVQYQVDTGAKPEGGSCLACVSIPRTNLTVDA